MGVVLSGAPLAKGGFPPVDPDGSGSVLKRKPPLPTRPHSGTGLRTVVPSSCSDLLPHLFAHISEQSQFAGVGPRPMKNASRYGADRFVSDSA